MDFATEPRFVYRHSWRVGDLVMWDNRCTMHRAQPFDDARYRRDIRRTTVRDTEAVYGPEKINFGSIVVPALRDLCERHWVCPGAGSIGFGEAGWLCRAQAALVAAGSSAFAAAVRG